MVYWRTKPTRGVGRTFKACLSLEKLVNYSRIACDLQAFLVFSQNTKWVYYAGKPIENAVYCLHKVHIQPQKELHAEPTGGRYGYSSVIRTCNV